MRTAERPPRGFEERLLVERRTLVAEQPPAVEPQRPSPRRRGASAGIAVAVATAAILAIAGLGPSGRSPVSPEPGRAWAASAVRVANAVPRLLIGEPGWRVLRADEFAVRSGEMTFAHGDRSAELHWRPERWHRGYVKDRAADMERLGDVSVDGIRARLYRSRETPRHFTAMWRSDGYSLEFRTGLSGPAGRLAEQDFRDLLESIRRVDVDAWLGALPASVVRPDARRSTVRRMLDGIPLPRGFDPDAISVEGEVSDRYQLGAQVSGAVACAWIRQWVEARERGDDRAAAAAVSAMATSRRWPILLEMSRDGYYPHAVWEYADAIAGGGTVLGGRVLTVEEAYRDGLGCRG